MQLYDCRLTFHDNLFYETRTMGRFYETGRLLHNIALTYALGLAHTSYYHADDVPRYGEELAALNEAGVYVTPAHGENVRFTVSTFKFGEERSAMFMEKANRNRPTYGRAKEVAVNSVFRFGVLSEAALTFPRWIRMGLWMSKAQLSVAPPIMLTQITESQPQTIRRYPLNPADLPDSAALQLFDLVAMRPSNLLENVVLAAETWWRGQHDGETLYLPAGLRYRVADAPPNRKARRP
ncbi:MAG: type I-D CRISPR-associated protein Cas5/Csc1 [Chloroflexi bacterium]|nr:type I-D CRISPR-associated protein Cas5/Csc1 [Chloroflexota bacterium]